MAAEFISSTAASADPILIERVSKALNEGAVVAFPTETVYGVAANAAHGRSVERLRVIKGRAADQPFTVHIGRREACDDFVLRASPLARRLMAKGWPGPLTLVFPVDDPTLAPIHPRLSPAGADAIYRHHSVGVRYPDHPLAAALLARTAAPIIASSANPAGLPAPTDADAARQALGDDVDIILDGGPCRYRKSSTIVALNDDGYAVVRAGVWDERTIRRMATLNILFVCTGNTCRSPMAGALFRRMLAEKLGCEPEDLPRRGIAVLSAGTMAFPGGPASREAVVACRKRGLDLSGHVAQTLTVELIRAADYIYTMGQHHVDVVRSLSAGDAAKATPLDPDADITDPMGGTQDDYEAVAVKLTEALRKRLDEVPV